MSMAHVSRKMHLLAGLKTECNMLVVDKKVLWKGQTEQFVLFSKCSYSWKWEVKKWYYWFWRLLFFSTFYFHRQTLLDNVVYRTSFSLISIYAMHFPLSSWFSGAFSQSQKWRNKYPTYKLLIRLNIKHNHRKPLWCCCVSQKIFKIYKTYKLIQSARNTPNKSADMYKKTSYKLRTKLKNVLLTTHTAHQGL